MQISAEPYIVHGNNVRDSLILMDFIGKYLKEEGATAAVVEGEGDESEEKRNLLVEEIKTKLKVTNSGVSTFVDFFSKMTTN